MNANNNPTPKSNGQPTLELPFSEAPASWNTRYIDPSGFECQITLRGETGKKLLEQGLFIRSKNQKMAVNPRSPESLLIVS